MVLLHQATYSHDNRTQITHTPCITQLNTHIMRQSIIVNYDGTLTRQTTHDDPLTRKKGLRLGWLFLMLSSTSGGVGFREGLGYRPRLRKIEFVLVN